MLRDSENEKVEFNSGILYFSLIFLCPFQFQTKDFMRSAGSKDFIRSDGSKDFMRFACSNPNSTLAIINSYVSIETVRVAYL